MRALITRIIARLERLAGEGKTDMAEIVTATEGAAAQGSSEIDKLVAGFEADAKAFETSALPVFGSPNTGTSTTATVAADIDAIVVRVKELLAVSGQTPKAWSQIVDYAGTLVPVDDTDAMLAKVKELLQYSGTTLTGWDQLIALAKTLAA